MEKTLQITDKELHSSLQDFLEEKEKKPAEGIWNFTTVAGLGLVLSSAAYVGYFVGTEIFGFGTLALMNTIMKIAPYFAGALLLITILSMFTSRREKKQQERKEEVKVQEVYDKLDEFLYSDEEKKKARFSSSAKKSHNSFRVNTSNKLMKSRTDKKLSGVCGGLAKHLGISSTILRFIFVAAVFLSSSTFILVYIAMAIVMPKEPVDMMDDFN